VQNSKLMNMLSSDDRQKKSPRFPGGSEREDESGRGISLGDLFQRMAVVLGVRPIAEADPELVRPADIPYLVGDAAKLRAATGWTPRHGLDAIIRQVLDATAV